VKTEGGYTLIEVALAGAILMVALGAAASLALTTIKQEETAARVSRCLNLHEQAVRLYQLGLDPATISDILPADPAWVSLNFSTQSVTITNLGTVEQATSTLTFVSTGTASGDAIRTNVVIAIRPSLR